MNPFPKGNKIPNPPPRITVFPHLEMGDALISNAICRAYASRGKPLSWFCDVKYVWDVRRMYEDLPNVQVFGALGYDDIIHRWKPSTPDGLGLGFFSNGDFNVSKWDSEFYRQAGLPFDVRWSGFKLPSSLRLAEPTVKDNVALIHEDHNRGFTVIRKMLPPKMKHTFIKKRGSFWDWMPELLAAKELHFIDSSFLNLAESLYALGYLRGTKLVWHKYAKHYQQAGPPELRAPWSIIQ